MYSLHHSLQLRSVQKKQHFNVFSKHFVTEIQINLFVYNIFVFYKSFSEKDLLSSLLRAYIVLLFICDLI